MQALIDKKIDRVKNFFWSYVISSWLFFQNLFWLYAGIIHSRVLHTLMLEGLATEAERRGSGAAGSGSEAVG